MRTSRRVRRPPTRHMGIAKMVATISNRCSSVLGSVEMAASPYASGCAMAIAVIV
jgi:hypothetical protein